MSMRELLLEVEVVVNAVVEWSELGGWQVRGCSPTNLPNYVLSFSWTLSAMLCTSAVRSAWPCGA